MGDFGFFFREGILHITDWNGYDHILFVTALCLPYPLNEWRKLLILITAFTLGHSVTLALSVYDQIIVSSKWIELLIPLTIAVTALENVLIKDFRKGQRLRYLMALLFGLIHGMGFSNYLRSMLGKGRGILTELLAFNLGLEAGQLLIVAAVLLLVFIFVQLLKVSYQGWLFFVSGGIFSLALMMALERSRDL